MWKNPNCKSYENKTLDEIVQDVIGDYADRLETEIKPRFSGVIPYCVQYNETDYQFLQRLAKRYGEWMYNDGERFVFGVMPDGERVKLTYPRIFLPTMSI